MGRKHSVVVNHNNINSTVILGDFCQYNNLTQDHIEPLLRQTVKRKRLKTIDKKNNKTRNVASPELRKNLSKTINQSKSPYQQNQVGKKVNI